ncbi:type II toxin -antitoxin system TacA 1-like antitoxin [Pseudazoarcus pumilus]|uniref:DUF1778 domain-containing protein n=1 Tax=Pseudazoarcus pumilus TaxID=2067960 RepID=A0A2I6S3Q2_9RHOO|nr:DUF1778 domain-containing protein [Pseudazoarcus pumilus]AUN93847.1 hypothetical protein C0099_02165 [Pseudazoarcus pumilus]
MTQTAPDSTIRLALRMTREQHELLLQAATAAGMSVPDFAIESIVRSAHRLMGTESGVQTTHRFDQSVSAGPAGQHSAPRTSFTKPALMRWQSMSEARRRLLLSNVWCSRCRHEVTITDFSAAIKDGDLLLVGRCAECRGDVARVVES